jgi:hypothetical protein
MPPWVLLGPFMGPFFSRSFWVRFLKSTRALPRRPDPLEPQLVVSFSLRSEPGPYGKKLPMEGLYYYTAGFILASNRLLRPIFGLNKTAEISLMKGEIPFSAPPAATNHSRS